MSKSEKRQDSPCEIKQRMTSHWDWDLMSQAEIEACFRAGRRRLVLRRSALAAVVVSGLGILVAAGLYLYLGF